MKTYNLPIIITCFFAMMTDMLLSHSHFNKEPNSFFNDSPKYSDQNLRGCG